MRLNTKIIAILLLMIVLDAFLGSAFYYFRAQIQADHNLQIHSTVILGLVVAINIGLIYYLTKKVIILPIQKLITATQKMGVNGSIDMIDINTNDEFDQLARSLESSSVAIQAYYQKVQSSQQALNYSEERFHDVADAAGEYIWEITVEGVFRFATSRAEDVYGRKIEFLLGKSIFDFVQEDERDSFKKILSESAVDQKAFKNIELPTIHRNGLVIWQKLSGLPVLNERGAIAFFRGVGLEVTDYKMIAKRLEEKEESLIQLSCQLSESESECRTLKKQVAKLGDTLKTVEGTLEIAKLSKVSFLKNVNHEISTPLANITGMFELMKRTPLDGEQQKYASIANESVATLLTVMHDAIDYTKLEARVLELHLKNFRLDELIQDIVAAKRIKAQEKKLKLIVKISDDSTLSLSGDSLRIKQVLDNLLSNAIKFTAQGTIDLFVQTEQREDSHILLRCVVKDTGVGIDPRLAQNLFDYFTYENGIANERLGSRGLGLSISKQLCELMGGQIGYNPDYENGSEFWFEIVCDQANLIDVEKEEKSKEIRLSVEESIRLPEEKSKKERRKPI